MKLICLFVFCLHFICCLSLAKNAGNDIVQCGDWLVILLVLSQPLDTLDIHSQTSSGNQLYCTASMQTQSHLVWSTFNCRYLDTKQFDISSSSYSSLVCEQRKETNGAMLQNSVWRKLLFYVDIMQGHGGWVDGYWIMH